MAVSVSNHNMYVQLIDDGAGRTMASVSTLGTESRTNLAAAAALGKRAADVAKAKGIATVVVDRGGHRYHGRVKAIVEAAVAAGLVTGATLETKEAE